MERGEDLKIRDDEAEYVACFWSALQHGRAHAMWGDVIALHVTAADVAAFPELAGLDVVALRVTDGEVHETSPEDAAFESLRG